MATAKKQTSLAEMVRQEGDLDKQQAALDARAEQSGSFWSESAPTGSELSLDIQKRALKAKREKLEGNILTRRAYGEDKKRSEEEVPEGIVEKGLNTLSGPLYGVVGATKHVMGKGEGTFGESVMRNVKTTRDTFGDILKQSGMAPIIAAPLGFGMDVIADPVNLLSGGLVGLSRTGVGKVVKGAAKAGVEGAVAGAKTAGMDMLSTAARVADLMPGMGVNKKAAKLADEMLAAGIKNTDPAFAQAVKKVLYPSDKGFGKLIGDTRTGIKNIYDKAIEAKNNYDDLVGFDVKKTLDEAADRESIADRMKRMLVSLPGGEKMVDFFEYNSNKWMQNARLYNLMENAFKKAGQIRDVAVNPNTGVKEYPGMDEILGVLRSLKSGADEVGEDLVNNSIKFKDRATLSRAIEKQLDDSIEAMNYAADDVRIKSAKEARDAVLAELRNTNSFNDIQSAFRDLMGDEELSVVDKLRRSIEEKFVLRKATPQKIEYGKKLLKFYDLAMGFFKSAKISSLSPSSMVYAILGNGTMQHMAGINMLRPEVYSRLTDAAVLLTGGRVGGLKKFESLVDDLLKDPKMDKFFTTHGNLAKQVLGLDIKELAAREVGKLDDAMKVEMALVGRPLTDGERDILWKEVYSGAEAIRIKNLLESSTSMGFMKAAKGDLPSAGMSTGILANELAPYKAFVDLKKKIADKAAEKGSGFGVKALNFALNRSKDFEMTDQVWKLQNFLLLTQDGLTERELLKLTNNFGATVARISSADIVETAVKGGQKYYKLSPDKAIEVANEIFMNYAAMPGFVKMIRSMPVLGSPFFSFTYAMLQKTAKTMATNPAAFNQVNFLIKELESDKSPLERAALKSKYYSWLDKPGIVNLGENVPFFYGNPLYLNLSQMIPYYSMNILNPSSRKFNDNVRGKFASVLDRSPLMKDPIGQMLMDYVVLPSLLYDEIPQNMFGGQLYPTGTGVAGRVGYALRSGAEAFLPSGVAPIGMVVPDSMKNFLPSYHARKLGFAAQGKTSIGVQTKEPPAQKALRASLGVMGVNLYPVDLTMIATEIKKKKPQQ